jgi:hypothetical protein
VKQPLHHQRIWLATLLIKLAGRLVNTDIYNEVIRDNERLIEVARAAKRAVNEYNEFGQLVDNHNFNILWDALQGVREELTWPASLVRCD